MMIRLEVFKTLTEITPYKNNTQPTVAVAVVASRIGAVEVSSIKMASVGPIF